MGVDHWLAETFCNSACSPRALPPCNARHIASGCIVRFGQEAFPVRKGSAPLQQVAREINQGAGAIAREACGCMYARDKRCRHSYYQATVKNGTRTDEGRPGSSDLVHR